MKRHDEDPAALEREIEQTRQRIDSTLQELGDRLSPGQLLDQALDRLRGASAPRQFASNLARSAEDHPLPVVLVGVGLAWLMFSERAGGRRRVERSTNELDRAFGGNGGGVMEGAAETARGAVSAVGEAASAVGDRVQRTREKARHATTRVSEGAQRGAANARSAWQHVRDEQPLVLALAGLAVGAALGGSLPRTESEDTLLGETRDEVLSRGARAARDAGEAVRRVASAADGGSAGSH
jgi:hypothetical protein